MNPPSTRVASCGALARIVIIGMLWLALWPGLAFAQVDNRPSNDRLSLPPLDGGKGPELALPSIDPLEGSEHLSSGLSVRVTEFDFEGHSAFSTEELRVAVSDFRNRQIDSEDLLAARDRITRLYIDAGYTTSGAIIPDQRTNDGRLKIQIVEGELGAIEINGTNRFRESYFRGRLARSGQAPLNVNELELALQRFQRDLLIEQVTARLEPTSVVGQSRLILTVVEARQEDLRIGAENDRSPSVGDESIFANARVANLLGLRDEFNASVWVTAGLRDVDVRYAVPVTSWDTRIEARVRWTESEIVEFPFDGLDIESESLTVTLGVEQPVYRSREHLIRVGVRGEWRKGRSTLGGQDFCFQPGVLDCTPSTAILRLKAEWEWQGDDAVLSARTTFSWGTGWLGATTRAGNFPDGRFASWLGQFQFARRLPLSSRIIARFDAQLTDDALLSYERIAIGGARTVRGYRANQIVRDNGLIGSLEWRVPIWKRSFGSPYIELAPFWDIGHGWNGLAESNNKTISSLGLGLLMRPFERVEAEIYWGGRIVGVDRNGSGLIGDGVHFRVIVDAW